MKTLACRDTGVDCGWVGREKTEDELLSKAAQHVKEVHMTEMTPEMKEMARKVIRDE